MKSQPLATGDSVCGAVLPRGVLNVHLRSSRHPPRCSGPKPGSLPRLHPLRRPPYEPPRPFWPLCLQSNSGTHRVAPSLWAPRPLAVTEPRAQHQSLLCLFLLWHFLNCIFLRSQNIPSSLLCPTSHKRRACTVRRSRLWRETRVVWQPRKSNSCLCDLRKSHGPSASSPVKGKLHKDNENCSPHRPVVRLR